MFGNKGNGYSWSISLEGNYAKKVEELDKFLIKKIYQNRVSWKVGEKVPLDAIGGYDDFGTVGKYKRVLKYPYRTENGEKICELDKSAWLD